MNDGELVYNIHTPSPTSLRVARSLWDSGRHPSGGPGEVTLQTSERPRTSRAQRGRPLGVGVPAKLQ